MKASLCADEEFVRIYETYADTVYRIAFLLLKNTQEAEDTLQNVFVKLMKTGKKFESEAHLKAWLICAAKSGAKDVLKSFWRRKMTGMETVAELAYNQPEGDSAVYTAVMQLKAKYRIPLYLFYYEGYSTDEIAKMLAVKPTTVRAQLCYARQKLKLVLEEEESDA